MFVLYYFKQPVEAILYFLLISVVFKLLLFNLLSAILISRAHPEVRELLDVCDEPLLENKNLQTNFDNLYSSLSGYTSCLSFQQLKRLFNRKAVQNSKTITDNYVIESMDKLVNIPNSSKYSNTRNVSGTTFFFLTSDSKVRIMFSKLVTKNVYFDVCMAVTVIASLAVLVLDSPTEQNEKTKYILCVVDLTVNIIFILEFFIKVTAFGFIFNGPDSFMRNGFDCLDFVFIVVSTWLLVERENAQNVTNILRMVKGIRVARMIKMVGNFKALSIFWNTVKRSLRQIVAIVLSSLTILLIFAIFAVYFMYDECVFDGNENYSVSSKLECGQKGGIWVYSTDLPSFLLSLVELIGIDGWTVRIYSSGKNHLQPWWAVYYTVTIILIYFGLHNILLGCFADNLFVETNKLSSFVKRRI